MNNFTIYKQFSDAGVGYVYTFAALMKKIAAILVLIFVLVQFGPAVCFVFSSHTIVFLVDEEKSTQKSDIGASKEMKEYLPYSYSYKEYAEKIKTAFLLSVKIELYPTIEMLAPPPNYS